MLVTLVGGNCPSTLLTYMILMPAPGAVGPRHTTTLQTVMWRFPSVSHRVMHIQLGITEWENQACITGNTSKAIFHQKLMEGARMGRWGPKELIHLHMQLVQLAGFQVVQNWCGDP